MKISIHIRDIVYNIVNCKVLIIIVIPERYLKCITYIMYEQ